MPAWYPMMLNVEGRKCVVIGGGPIAERKALGLLQANALVIVISPKLSQVLQQRAEKGQLVWLKREAQADDLADAVLVFAATDQPKINQWIAEEAGRRAIPVNRADDGENGDFIVPAVLRQGELVLTASTSGAGPALASRIIQELSERYGPEYNKSIQILRDIRSIVRAEITDRTEQRELLRAAVSDEALEEWRTAPWLHDKDKLIARLRRRVNDRKG